MDLGAEPPRIKPFQVAPPGIRVATGQEMVRENKILDLQGQGKVREFYFESGKIDIFEEKSGEIEFISLLM